MANTIARLNIMCGATDNASGVLGGIIGNLGKIVAVGAVIGGMAFIGKKALDSFIEFDQAITNSLAMFDNFGGELRGQVEDTSRALSKELGFSATEVAEAFYYLGSAGLSVEESLAAIDPVARFAMATNIDMADAADVATISMKAFGQTSGELPHTLDVLANTVRNTNTNMSQLSDAFGYVAPVAAAFGMSVEEVSSALGMMANAGIKGSMAGTGLRRIITNLVAPTGQAAQAIENLGVQVYETGSSGNSLISSIGACQTELDRYQQVIDSATDALLGLEDAQRGFSIEMQTSQLEIMKIRDKAMDENRDLTQSETQRVETLEGTQRDLRISMAENRLESDKLVDQQKDAQTEIDNLTENIEDNQEALEDAGGEMRDFGDILEDIESGTDDMTEAEKNQNLTMLAGVRGISGLISMLGDGGQEYKDFVTDAEEANGVVKEMSDFMATGAGVKMDIFKQHINDLAITLGEKLFPAVEKITNWFTNSLVPALDTLKTKLQPVIDAFSEILSGDWDTLKTSVLVALGSIKDTLINYDWGAAWDGFVNYLKNVDWGSIANTIGDAIVGGINWINDELEGTGDTLGDMDWFQAGRDASQRLQDWGDYLGGNFEETMKEGGEDGAEGMGNRFVDAIGGVFYNIGVIIKEFALGMPPLIGGFLYDMMLSAWDWVTDAFNDWWTESGKPWILDLPNKIKEAMGNAGNWLYDKGKEVLQGLINGLLDKVPGLNTAVNTIVNVIKGIITAVTNALAAIGLLERKEAERQGYEPSVPGHTYTPGAGEETPWGGGTSSTGEGRTPNIQSGLPEGMPDYGSFGYRLDDFILSGGRLHKVDDMDTIIGTRTPGRTFGGGTTYHIVQNLSFQNVADETYIHKIGSLVQRNLERVIA